MSHALHGPAWSATSTSWYIPKGRRKKELFLPVHKKIWEKKHHARKNTWSDINKKKSKANKVKWDKCIEMQTCTLYAQNRKEAVRFPSSKQTWTESKKIPKQKTSSNSHSNLMNIKLLFPRRKRDNNNCFAPIHSSLWPAWPSTRVGGQDDTVPIVQPSLAAAAPSKRTRPTVDARARPPSIHLCLG